MLSVKHINTLKIAPIGIFKITLFCFLAFCITGCFEAGGKYSGSKAARPTSGGLSRAAEEPSPVTQSRNPWELWEPGQNMRGGSLLNVVLRQGDEQLRQGDLQGALVILKQTDKSILSPDDRAAAVIRIAGTQLTLGLYSDAINTLSSYFRALNKQPVQVESPFALVFGFAYGRQGVIDQSLAWLFQAVRGESAFGSTREIAQYGIRSLLKSVSDEKLIAIGTDWEGEAMVRGMVGQERQRRSSGGRIEPFALGFDQPTSRPLSPSVASPILANGGSSGRTVGVFLPLTGRFAGLGNSVKNGITLAVDAQINPSSLNIIFKDSGEDVSKVSANIEELARQGSNLIIGPLLSELAPLAGDAARQVGVPLLSLSKNSGFITGRGVYRLGATIESQVSSLIDDAVHKLGLRRIGVIYTQDDPGNEFASAVRKKLSEEGLAPVLDRFYSKGDDSSMTGIAALVPSTTVDAILFSDNIIAAGRFFGAMPSTSRERIKMLGGANWDNLTELMHSKAILDGAYYASPFLDVSSRPVIVSFVRAYEARFGRKPDFLAAQGFDAATIAFAALDRQASNQGASFESALNSIDQYDGLTGLIVIDPTGELKRKFVTAQFINGTIIEVSNAPSPTYVYRGDEAVRQETAKLPDMMDNGKTL